MSRTPRADVYAAIDTERAYQDKVWQDQQHPGNPNPLTLGENILLIEEYAAKARASWSVEREPEYESLHIIRKIAGIAVRTMEQHGALKRK